MLITTVFGGKNDYQTLEFLTTEIGIFNYRKRK